MGSVQIPCRIGLARWQGNLFTLILIEGTLRKKTHIARGQSEEPLKFSLNRLIKAKCNSLFKKWIHSNILWLKISFVKRKVTLKQQNQSTKISSKGKHWKCKSQFQKLNREAKKLSYFEKNFEIQNLSIKSIKKSSDSRKENFKTKSYHFDHKTNFNLNKFKNWKSN